MAEDQIGFYRIDQILELIPVSKSLWRAWVADGKAPKSIKLSQKNAVWKQADIHALIDAFCEE
ncbi:MAG: hypothetical protein V7707_02490 [Motiliproteus sp.]